MLVKKMVAAQEAGSRRVMVVLHGLGDSMAGYAWLPEMLRLPWLSYLFVNAPDSYFGGFSWYDFAGQPGPGIVRSRGLLTKLLDTTRDEGFPTEETTLFGFSQGCLMVWEMGLHYPRRFAGCVGISGYAHEPEKVTMSPVAKEQRFLITHGTFDNLIPFESVRGQVHSLQKAELNITWREFAKDHTIAGEEELKVIREFVANGYKK